MTAETTHSCRNVVFVTVATIGARSVISGPPFPLMGELGDVGRFLQDDHAFQPNPPRGVRGQDPEADTP